MGLLGYTAWGLWVGFSNIGVYVVERFRVQGFQMMGLKAYRVLVRIECVGL